MSPFFSRLIPNASTCVDRKGSLEVYGVCITPAFIEFKHPFEGRTYRRYLTIRNVGKSKVVVKITKPTSLAFGIKEVKGYSLPSGLCLVKEVSYVYTHVNVPYCMLPIYINRERIDYEIFAQSSAPEISLQPQSIDFGIVDKDCSSKTRILRLQNDGSKTARFHIDSSSLSDHKIMVDPYKGYIQPRSIVELRVNLISSTVGIVNGTIWLKCGKPFAIPVRGELISPMFEPICDSLANSFIVIDFPPTYLGTETIALLRLCFVSGARWLNVQCFQPTRCNSQKLDSFYFCIYRLYRTKCKYLRASMYKELKGEPSVLLESNASCIPPESQQKSNECLLLYLHGVAEAPSVTVVPNEIFLTDLVDGEGTTRVLEFHNRSTKLPIIISYKKVAFVDVDRQSVRIESNKSVQLSLFVTPRRLGKFSTKIEFDLLHYENFLEKNALKVVGTIWVQLHVVVKGVKKSALPDINAGITPNYIKEVGKFCQEVRFNTKVAKPKTALVRDLDKSSALIAFPNDTQQSLRPWRGSKIKTIFAKIPRYVPPLETEYEMTVFGKKVKMAAATYCTNYARKEAEKLRLLSRTPLPRKSQNDYCVTDNSKLLCRDLPLVRQINSPEKILTGIIPLTPTEINNINIDPMVVLTGRIAVNSKHKFDLHITNNNIHPIRIYIRPEKPNIIFEKGNRKVIKAHGEADIPITYITENSGYYTTSLDVIVNECGVFCVTVLADVSRLFLDLNINLVKFYDETVQFVEISNTLNTDIPFQWSLQHENYCIEPSEGVLNAFSKLLCQVIHLPEKGGPTKAEAELLIEDTITQVLNLRVIDTSANIHFVRNNLVFTDVPLNIPTIKTGVLRNLSSYSRAFTLKENEFAEYLTVDPMDGRICGNSHTIICFTLKMTTCGEFSTKLTFQVTGIGIIELYISGNVVYPDVEIAPRSFKFEKMPASTTSVICFTVENRSNAIASVKFDMSIYNDFKITDTKAHWIVDPIEELMLEARGSKRLYLNFLPRAATTDKFYLPLIVNGIIHPSTTGNDTACRLVPNFPVRTISDSLIFVRAAKVCVYSTEPKLQFSKFKISLWYKIPPYQCRNEYNLRVFNPQKVGEAFCIKTKRLEEPFSIIYLSGKEITRYENSIVCYLAPEEEVVFKVCYKPTTIGVYSISLPIYLRSDQCECPHNTLQIEGKFDAPTMFIPNIFMYFKPVPLNICNTAYFKVSFDNHLHNCKPYTSCDLRGFHVELEDNLPDNCNRRIVALKLKYTSDNPGRTTVNFIISCTCGVSTSVPIIACRENCFLTNYGQVQTFIRNSDYNLELREAAVEDEQTSLSSVLEKSRRLKETYERASFFFEYPLYPNDEVELKQFMDEGIRTVEQWVSSHIFLGKAYFEIPTSFAHVLFISPVVIPPFIQVLINLGGEDMRKCFNHNLQGAPTEDVEKVRYLCTLYERALEILQGLGALIVVRRPELLLTYTHYNIYVDNFQTNEPTDTIHINVTSSNDFIRLSKQCWFDLLLQTYKVLVLNRLIFCDKKIYKAPKLSPAHERYTSSIKGIARSKHLFNNTELLLMDWLEFHYNDIRQRLWSRHKQLEPRNIRFYGEGMEDGFVYAAVTIAYCPYFTEHFEGLLPEPTRLEEILHNNMKVIQSWHILNFSMKLSVKNMIAANSFQTLFLMVYLYQMLPNLYPSETLTFRANLSKHVQKKLLLKNVNNFPIAYKAIIYGGDSNCFQTNSEFYVINPRRSCEVIIDYWAKFIKESRSTLILSGECKGYHYAKSMAMTMVGIPNVQHVAGEFTSVGLLYKVIKQQLDIKSPYLEAATYRMQFTYVPGSNIDEVNKLPYREDFPNHCLVRILPVPNNLAFDDHGDGVLSFYILSLRPVDIPTWIYFRNPIVGDFAIKLTTSCKAFYSKEVVKIYVPQEKNATECERIVNLSLPCQNKFVWKAIADMYSTVTGTDVEFWKKYSSTEIGIHILLKMMLFSVPPYNYRLCDITKYKVKVTKNCQVKFPKYIDLGNECSTGSVDIPLKIRAGSKLPEPVDLYLEAVNGLKVRYYKITFSQDPESP